MWFLGGQAPHPLLKSSINKMCLHLRGALTRGNSEAGVYWARGYITVSEPAKGAGASQGFWEKVGLKPGRQKDRPPGGRDHMVKCKEEGAGGQRGDCRVGSIHRGRVRADVEKAGNSEVTLGEAWKARPISPPRGQCARMLPTLSHSVCLGRDS